MNLLVRHASRFSPGILHKRELKNGSSFLVAQAAKPMRTFPGASYILTKPAIYSKQRHAHTDSTKLDRTWLVLRNET
eukprot:7051560-Pyramimonas_sp.AAC.1